MTRVNIELTIEGDPEDAFRAIDHLLDHGVIQGAIDEVRIDGSKPVRVRDAVAVWVTRPVALRMEAEVSNDLPPKSGEIGSRR